MNITIRPSNLDEPTVVRLLSEHLQNMMEISPPESVHALDLDGLRQPEISFWCAWSEDTLLGCGALKALSGTEGEIKSMRTVSVHRGNGVGRRLLDHILAQATQRRYARLSLETGSQLEFEPARRMYAKAGFSVCEPFANYSADPNSVFMTKALESRT